MNERRGTSLATKIAVFIALATASVLLIIGIVNQRFLRQVAEERGIEQLSASVALLEPFARSEFEKIARGLTVWGASPDVLGVIRAASNGGVDPLDGTSSEGWRRQTEVGFAGFLDAWPNYTQIRLISFAGDGRELVSVDRHDGAVVVIPEDDLQARVDEDYFQTALSMRPGEVAFSDVDLNVESGDLKSDDSYTFGVFGPVFTENGMPFGLLIINADFRATVDNIVVAAQGGRRITLMTDNGAIFSKQSSQSEFIPTGRASDEHTELSRSIANFESSGRTLHTDSENGAITTFFRDISYGRAPYERSLRIAVSTPTAALFREAGVLVRTQSMISAALIVAVCILSLLAARLITNPLQRLDAAIKRFGHIKTATDLPTGRNDEIGQIARSFDALQSRLRMSEASERRTFARMQAIVQQSIDCLITINGSGTMLSINPAAEREFGYVEDEVVGQNVSMLMPEPDRSLHDGYLKAYEETGVARIIGKTRQVQAQRKDGSLLDAELAISKVEIEGEEVIYSGLVRNVTARNRAEQALQKYANELSIANSDLNGINKQLDLANEDLKSFTYIVSHDLRAPLVNLQGFSDMLAKSIDEIGTRVRESVPSEVFEDIEELLDQRVPTALQYISDSATKMQEQLDAILEVSRLGRYAIEPEPVELMREIDKVLNAHLGSEWAETVQLEIEPLPRFMTDKQAIRIILNNLCSNAVRYQAKDRPLRIVISAKTVDEQLCIAVADNGRGMSENDLAQMYKLFRRCGRPDTKGQGIGLTYVKTLIERMEGTITCESEPGVGTTFSVRLPRQSCQPISEEAA